MKQEIMNMEEYRHAYMHINFNDENVAGTFMGKKIHCPEQLYQEKPKLIFQFPAKSMEDELVKKEIKSILINALQEQVHSVTS